MQNSPAGNVEQPPKIASIYQVIGVPTFILFHSGEEMQRRVGAQSKEQLKQMVKLLS